MECHVQGDFLLVWINEEEDTVYLVRLGSHSELFGKTAADNTLRDCLKFI